LAEGENYYASEVLKGEYFTRNGDVLLRLSAPYTASLITEKETGLLVPAHFAIIRPLKMLDSSYLHWWLMKNRKQFYMIASGATMMGTISSGYIAEIPFDPPAFEKQRKIGELLRLASHEQQLLSLLGAKKKQLIDAAIKSMEEMTL
jgi:restriction endonuclease S subunit